MAKKTKKGNAKGSKTDMFVRAITTAINSMGGGLRQRYSTKLVEKAISTLGEGASRYELRDWMDANDPPIVRVVGGGKRARRQRDVARRLILDSWNDFAAGKTDLGSREDLTPLGQCLVKYYQTTFAPDAPTLSVEGVEYLAIGSPPKEGMGRKKSFARWEGGARVRIPSHQNATKISNLGSADFKTLFPRRAAWDELVMTASK